MGVGIMGKINLTSVGVMGCNRKSQPPGDFHILLTYNCNLFLLQEQLLLMLHLFLQLRCIHLSSISGAGGRSVVIGKSLPFFILQPHSSAENSV